MVRVGVIGGGAMGGAIVRGCLDAGVVPADGWVVADPEQSKRAGFELLGVQTMGSARGLIGHLGRDDAVLLAVKPQQLGAVAGEIQKSGFEGLVLTILAGTPSEAVRDAFGGVARVVRAMPNKPARVGLGLTGIARGAGATDEDLVFAERLFSAVGRVVRIDEAQMDALTAVAGSGPAYVFYLAEAMERAGRDLGLPEEEIRGIVSQTIVGASALLNEADAEATTLRRAVTSKRGTTEAATTQLDDDGVMRAIERAIGRACERGRELAAGKE